MWDYGRLLGAATLIVALIALPAVSAASSSRAGEEEVVPEGYSDTLTEILHSDKFKGLLKNSNVLKTIEKRLGVGRDTSADDESPRDGSSERELARRRGGLDDGPTCPDARSKTGYIIKTKDSLGRGAVFLQSPKAPSTPDDCVQECCENRNCSTAVIKTSPTGPLMACYLFDCRLPNVCLFSANQDFTVVQLALRGSQKKQEHEEELAELMGGETTLAAPTTNAPTSTAPQQHKDKIGGLGGSCTLGSDCSVANSRCVRGSCVCVHGFHQFNDRCKADCREYQFECRHVDQDCIAIYDRCDGIEQCIDKSDELNCPAPSGLNASVSVTSTTQATSGESKQSGDSNASSKEHDDSVPNDNTKNKNNADNKNEVKDKSKEIKDKSKEVKHKSKEASDNHSKESGSAPEKRVNNDSHGGAEPESMEGHHWGMPANRGAVVALVLGMLVTALLLVMVGCRLRSVRRRSHKGRPLGGHNDADYLINGMYL